MKSAALKFAKLILIFAISYSPVISQTQTSQNQDSSSSDEVVKISTNLVQIDAVVTDKDGNHVRDLSAEDFEVYEDGKKQEITNFSYIQTAATSTNALTEKKVVNKTAINNLPPISPTRIRSENVKRTIALVVDDLGLSFESMVFVRNALIKFVNEQMQPNDLIAIVRTSAGTGALQQFTTDKRLLLAAIDRIQFSFKGNIELGNFSPLKQAGLGRPNGNPSNVSSAPTNDGLEEFRRDSFVIGTLGAVSYVIRGLRDMPGRKSVIFLSDGISIYSGLIQGSRAAYNNSFLGNGYQDKVIDAMLRLTDQANRASVVISTVDARGLITLKEFSPSQKSSNEDITLDAVQRLREDIFSSQAGL
ncbi:MAG TPA: VWA domain-containing protein, partial [Blastocatellia bacterium]|nr:VWA domain-containing protein [Blastocatellia bacterium]